MDYFKPEFLINVLTVFLGGGTVQLLIFLLRRKPELKKIQSDTDSVQVQASIALVTKLQEDGSVYRDQVKSLLVKVELMESKHNTAQESFAQQLRDAHSENTRLATRVAQVQTDLDIAQRQVDDLRRRLV